MVVWTYKILSSLASAHDLKQKNGWPKKTDVGTCPDPGLVPLMASSCRIYQRVKLEMNFSKWGWSDSRMW